MHPGLDVNLETEKLREVAWIFASGWYKAGNRAFSHSLQSLDASLKQHVQAVDLF